VREVNKNTIITLKSIRSNHHIIYHNNFNASLSFHVSPNDNAILIHQKIIIGTPSITPILIRNLANLTKTESLAHTETHQGPIQIAPLVLNISSASISEV